MIAERDFQGKRLGWEAMLLMLRYGAQYLNIKTFVVKVGESNEKSLRMFGKMGFQETSRSSVFKEVTLQKSVDDSWIQFLESNAKWDVRKYK